MPTTKVKAGTATFGGPDLVIIAGPCVIESYESCLRHATRLSEITSRAKLPFIFKSSFDKANRTSHESYRGPGLIEGLEILARVKREAGVAVLTDIHEPAQAAPSAKVVEVIQIKKGQFLAPWDMKAVVEQAESAGTPRIILTARGFSFGYNNLVSDMRS